MPGSVSHRIGQPLGEESGMGSDGTSARASGAQRRRHRAEAGAPPSLEQVLQELQAARAALAAKAELLSRVSHELRTPLNALIGFTQLLETDLSGHPLDETQLRRVRQVRLVGEYLQSMVADLLDLSLVDGGGLQLQMAAVALAPVAVECLDMVRGQADVAEVRLLPAEVADGLTVWADPVRLRQVLINLLTNAIKYNRPAGQVRLTARWGPERLCLVEVQDTGLGIPAEQAASLFQPFRRLGRESGPVTGAGLGLALSKALMTAMGGQIGVRSTSPAGTCLQLALRTPPTARD